jgi:hypothetical protein
MKLTVKQKQKLWHQIFFYILLLVSALMFIFGALFNTYFKEMFSTYQIVIQELRVPLLCIVIAPINEEIVKFIGYAFIYLFGISFIRRIGYASKKKFRNDYLIIGFLISVGGFGLFEGVIHNAGFGYWCFYGFVGLNMMIHITFAIYPYILGRRYGNMFFLFLPIAMVLHSVHNFIIGNIWDNKWVTLTMVTFLLLPIIIIERTKFYRIVERLFFIKFNKPKRVNLILSISFGLLYLYIVLCVWLRFL